MKRKYLLLSSAFFFILGIVLSHTYRAYIYNNNLFDFHLADTIGNWVAVPSATCLALVFDRERKLHEIVFYVVISFILYEIMGFGIFDIYDIIVTVLCGFITYFVLNRIYSKNKEK